MMRVLVAVIIRVYPVLVADERRELTNARYPACLANKSTNLAVDKMG